MSKQDKMKKTVFLESMFDFNNIDSRNSDSWKQFERISKSGDDRSKAILAGIIIEYYLDRLLKLLFIDYKYLTDRSDFTFSFKISILKSLRLIPINIVNMCDCVRKVRNEFAHNLELNEIVEIKKNLQDQIHQLYVENTSNKNETKLIRKFTGIYNLGYSGLGSFEQNIRLLREKIDDPQFEIELHKINDKRTEEYHENLIAKEPIRIERYKDKIEEIYPNGLGIIKNKNNR
jgi:hypothetical protein